MRTDTLIPLVQSLLPTGTFPALKADENPTHANLSRPQLQKNSPRTLTGLSANAVIAPVGINPECGILKAGANGSLGNIANIIACALSMILVSILILATTRRRAAVGASLPIFCVSQPPEHPA